MATLRSRGVSATLASLGVAVTFSVAGAVVGGSQALAGPVSCGDTITADTTLDSDLVDCSNNGIVIGADDITLDLNGHTIDGDGQLVDPCPDGDFCDAGVFADGHDGITVMNGSVRDFATGVAVGSARKVRLAGMSSTRNAFFGFFLFDVSHSVIRKSSGSRNPAPDGDGLGVFASRDNRIVDNRFSGNALGIHIEDSMNNLIKGNVISGQEEGPGIIMQADRNEMRGTPDTTARCLPRTPLGRRPDVAIHRLAWPTAWGRTGGLLTRLRTAAGEFRMRSWRSPRPGFAWNGEVSLAYQVEGEGPSARDNPQGQRIRGDLARHGRGGGRHGGPR